MFPKSRRREIEDIEKTIRNAHVIKTDNSIRIPYQVDNNWEYINLAGKLEIMEFYKSIELIDAYDEDGMYRFIDASFIDKNGCITWFSKAVLVSFDEIELTKCQVIHACAVREWSRVHNLMGKIVNFYSKLMIACLASVVMTSGCSTAKPIKWMCKGDTCYKVHYPYKIKIVKK